MELFAGFATAHGTHGVPTKAPDRIKWEIKSSARTLQGGPTLQHWEQHLAGKVPLGVITIREDDHIRWGSIDYDVYDENLLELIERVEQLKLPLVPCRSKSGGLHLFLFLQDWYEAKAVQPVLRDMAAQLGIAGSEIFPRQTKVLIERGDMGNWMVMPYYGNTYDGKIKEQVGLKRTGAEMTVTEFLRTAERARVSLDDLSQFARKHGSGGPSVNRGRKVRGGDSTEPSHPFADGPPCLETLAADGVPGGYQNNTLLQMGVYYKRKYPMEWQAKLEEAGRKFLTPPSTSEGMQSVIRSLEKKEYRYTCKTEPMVSHCNSAICRSRQHGVGDEGAYPIVNSMSVLMTDPPIYFVSVETVHGTFRIECDSGELQNYIKFCRKAVDQAQVSYCAMKNADWLKIISKAMEDAIPIKVSEAGGDSGMFHELLEEFLTNRQKGESLEDLLTGRPWLDPELDRYFFRMRDVHNFVLREGMKEPRNKVAQRLYDLGSKPHQLHVKGKTVRCVSIPANTIMPAIELDPKVTQESPI